MATLTIRNLPDAVRDKLRVRAAENGRSMEAEARRALTDLFPSEPQQRSDDEFRQRIRDIQQTMRQFVKPGVSIVDELIAERRWEAACEDAESDGLPRPARSDYVKDG